MNLQQPEVLELAPGLRLRRLRPDDAADVLAYASDPEFCRHIAAAPHRDLEDSRRFLADLEREGAAGRRLYWGVEHQGRIVGTIGFLNPDPERGSLELGFGVARPLWGGGVISSCLAALIELAFGPLGARVLVIGTATDNLRARGLALKHGFSPVLEREGRIYFERGRQPG